jgi:hypothetical protein
MNFFNTGEAFLQATYYNEKHNMRAFQNVDLYITRERRSLVLRGPVVNIT